MVRYGSFFGKSLLSGAAVVAIAAAGMVASAPAVFGTASSGGGGECWNAFIPVPTGSWNDLEVTFAGNQTGTISSQSYAGTNPFLSGTLNSAYNSVTNMTTVTYAGSAGTYGTPASWANYAVINGVGTSHFGLINALSNNNWLAPTSLTWTNSTNSTTSVLPAPPQIVPGWAVPTAGTGTKDLVLFLGSTDPGPTVGQWYEMPYLTGTPSSPVTVTNDGPGTDTFTDYGYFISDSQIPLDSLNYNDYPPPGQPGSPFTALPNPGSLSPGQSETIATPEPSALGLLALGGLALLARRHWLRAR